MRHAPDGINIITAVLNHIHPCYHIPRYVQAQIHAPPENLAYQPIAPDARAQNPYRCLALAPAALTCFSWFTGVSFSMGSMALPNASPIL